MTGSMRPRTATSTPRRPEADSALWLQQDRSLTPDAIVGPEIEAHLRSQRPAFFFNACQVGRQSWTLTRIGGWANRLISAGAGLFVGPLWEVSDGGALAFASAFYQALFARRDGGESGSPGARWQRVRQGIPRGWRIACMRIRTRGWWEAGRAWAAKVRQRHIGDFRGWKEHDAYRGAFERLVRDLKTER